MKENLTELVFIVDASGSMARCAKATVDGYNRLLAQQKEIGEATVSTMFFNGEQNLVHDRMDLSTVEPLTEADYRAAGCTALLDAMGTMIDYIGKKLADTPETERPAKVIFAIITDGLENSSREYSAEQIKDKVTHQREKYSWEFLFVGANIDVITTARDLGIDARHAFTSRSSRDLSDSGFRYVNYCLTASRLNPTEWDDTDGDLFGVLGDGDDSNE